MVLNEVTQVPDAALPVDEFRAHLRLGTGFGTESLQTGVLTGFLRAAMAAVEGQTGKALLMREFDLVLSAWGDEAGQGLPVAPVGAVTEMVLRDRAGAEVVVPPEAYVLQADTHRPVLCAAQGALPAIPLIGSVRVRFTAGLAAQWQDLPADLAQAVLLLAAYYYENRAEAGLGAGGGGGWMPYGVTSLLRRYKPMNLSAQALKGGRA